MQTFASPHCVTKQGLMTAVAVNRIQIAKRRSSRIALNARVGLSGQDREKRTFTMPARATNLNKHGAAIQLNRELLVGSAVVVQNGRGTTALEPCGSNQGQANHACGRGGDEHVQRRVRHEHGQPDEYRQ